MSFCTSAWPRQPPAGSTPTALRWVLHLAVCTVTQPQPAPSAWACTASHWHPPEALHRPCCTSCKHIAPAVTLPEVIIEVLIHSHAASCCLHTASCPICFRWARGLHNLALASHPSLQRMGKWTIRKDQSVHRGMLRIADCQTRSLLRAWNVV